MTQQEQIDLHDQIKQGRFEPVLEYPHRPQRPILKPNADSRDAQEWATKLELWEKDTVVWQRRIKEYRETRNRLDDSFKRACLKYVGLQGHPKADKAWSMAEDQSRSEGKIAVLDTLEEYADLLI